MDPKVWGKLLTHHRRGYGVDVEALRDQCPLQRSAGKGPKMGSHGYRRLRRWNMVFAPYLVVWGYVCIYRRKEYVGGATGGPQGWRACLGGRRAPCLVLSSLIALRRLQVLWITFVPKITFPKVSFRLDSIWYSFSAKLWNRQKNSNLGWASG